MAYLQHNQVGFKHVGTTANVPNNDVARLMYYLNCVCYTIEYNDNNISRYRNYNNWSSLSIEEIRLLVVLCYTLSPDEFNNKVFFHSDALCGDSSNRFYEISQVRTQLVAVRSVAIAGRTYRVNKIMTYTMSWMRSNYINPMQNVARQLNARGQGSSSSCVIS